MQQIIKNIYKRLKNMEKTGYWHCEDDRNKAYEIVSNGKVFVGDSDTVIGLYAPLSQQGFTALNDIKGRQEKPYLVLVSKLDDVKKYAHVPEHIESMLQTLWPGPLTVIMRAQQDVPSYMKSSTGAIALRIPDHEHIRSFVRDVGGVFSTSANLTGQPVPEKFEDIDSSILDAVQYVIHDADKVVTSTPSTIVDCSTGSCTIIREGVIPASMINSFFAS